MTADEFRAMGLALYGYGWQSALARTIDVNVKTVGRWTAGTTPLPAWLLVKLAELAGSPAASGRRSRLRSKPFEARQPVTRARRATPMSESTNRERSERALKALIAYSEEVGGSSEEIASDLVVDILHFIRRRGIALTHEDRADWLTAKLNIHETELTECEEG